MIPLGFRTGPVQCQSRKYVKQGRINTKITVSPFALSVDANL